MSELKDYDILDIEAMDDERLEKSESGKIQVTRVYIKDEADKVIAEKDTKIIQLVALIENYNRISGEIIDNANHQKHKRCLAMAELCCERKENCYNIALRKYTKSEADLLIKRQEFWEEWEDTWTQLAYRFKET